ncbi:hypothetical protein ONZ45_g1668 [Pleurotus djamor]|nr:hypothetical protein ONZ45_g1668 [Pleurotus djamor]
MDPRAPPLMLKDLECVRTLGTGVTGKVLLVRTRRDIHPEDRPGSLFAMKVMRKKQVRMMDYDSPEAKNSERSILMSLPWSPFICGLIQSFYDERNLYLLTELAPCGTLRSLISSKGPFPASQSLFYFCNILAALGFLEEHDIAHRDLKPDNILLDSTGYLTLIDFGTATVEAGEKEWIMIGTPCYQAPELLTPEGQTAGFSKAVDWWAAGCILFEMATRQLAFRGDSKQQTYKRILALDYVYPASIPVGRSLKSLIAGLLTRDAGKRLGANGASEVRKHPWLSTVRMSKIHSRQYLAPYLPPEQDLLKQWHNHPLPSQREVPGLTVVEPDFLYKHDDRFPKREDLA